MFTFATRGYNPFTSSLFDYNFGGDGTKYPNAANGYASAKVLNSGGSALAGGTHGVYLSPGAHKVYYIDKVVAFYNHTQKAIFNENYKETGGVLSGVRFSHTGTDYCDRFAPYGLSLISNNAVMELSNVFATNQYFYTQEMPLACPGRFDGDAGEHWGIHTRGGNAIYLGADYASNYLTAMHFMITGWEVPKVEVSPGVWEEVIYV